MQVSPVRLKVTDRKRYFHNERRSCLTDLSSHTSTKSSDLPTVIMKTCVSTSEVIISKSPRCEFDEAATQCCDTNSQTPLSLQICNQTHGDNFSAHYSCGSCKDVSSPSALVFDEKKWEAMEVRFMDNSSYPANKRRIPTNPVMGRGEDGGGVRTQTVLVEKLVVTNLLDVARTVCGERGTSRKSEYRIQTDGKIIQIPSPITTNALDLNRGRSDCDHEHTKGQEIHHGFAPTTGPQYYPLEEYLRRFNRNYTENKNVSGNKQVTWASNKSRTTLGQTTVTFSPDSMFPDPISDSFVYQSTRETPDRSSQSPNENLSSTTGVQNKVDGPHNKVKDVEEYRQAAFDILLQRKQEKQDRLERKVRKKELIRNDLSSKQTRFEACDRRQRAGNVSDKEKNKRSPSKRTNIMGLKIKEEIAKHCKRMQRGKQNSSNFEQKVTWQAKRGKNAHKVKKIRPAQSDPGVARKKGIGKWSAKAITNPGMIETANDSTGTKSDTYDGVKELSSVIVNDSYTRANTDKKDANPRGKKDTSCEQHNSASLIHSILESPTAKAVQALCQFYQDRDSGKIPQGANVKNEPNITVGEILEEYHRIFFTPEEEETSLGARNKDPASTDSGPINSWASSNDQNEYHQTTAQMRPRGKKENSEINNPKVGITSIGSKNNDEDRKNKILNEMWVHSYAAATTSPSVSQTRLTRSSTNRHKFRSHSLSPKLSREKTSNSQGTLNKSWKPISNVDGNSQKRWGKWFTQSASNDARSRSPMSLDRGKIMSVMGIKRQHSYCEIHMKRLREYSKQNGQTDNMIGPEQSKKSKNLPRGRLFSRHIPILGGDPHKVKIENRMKKHGSVCKPINPKLFAPIHPVKFHQRKYDQDEYEQLSNFEKGHSRGQSDYYAMGNEVWETSNESFQEEDNSISERNLPLASDNNTRTTKKFPKLTLPLSSEWTTDSETVFFSSYEKFNCNKQDDEPPVRRQFTPMSGVVASPLPPRPRSSSRMARRMESSTSKTSLEIEQITKESGFLVGSGTTTVSQISTSNETDHSAKCNSWELGKNVEPNMSTSLRDGRSGALEIQSHPDLALEDSSTEGVFGEQNFISSKICRNESFESKKKKKETKTRFLRAYVGQIYDSMMEIEHGNNTAYIISEDLKDASYKADAALSQKGRYDQKYRNTEGKAPQFTHKSSPQIKEFESINMMSEEEEEGGNHDNILKCLSENDERDDVIMLKLGSGEFWSKRDWEREKVNRSRTQKVDYGDFLTAGQPFCRSFSDIYIDDFSKEIKHSHTHLTMKQEPINSSRRSYESCLEEESSVNLRPLGSEGTQLNSYLVAKNRNQTIRVSMPKKPPKAFVQNQITLCHSTIIKSQSEQSFFHAEKCVNDNVGIPRICQVFHYCGTSDACIKPISNLKTKKKKEHIPCECLFHDADLEQEEEILLLSPIILSGGTMGQAITHLRDEKMCPHYVKPEHNSSWDLSNIFGGRSTTSRGQFDCSNGPLEDKTSTLLGCRNSGDMAKICPFQYPFKPLIRRATFPFSLSESRSRNLKEKAKDDLGAPSFTTPQSKQEPCCLKEIGADAALSHRVKEKAEDTPCGSLIHEVHLKNNKQTLCFKPTIETYMPLLESISTSDSGRKEESREIKEEQLVAGTSNQSEKLIRSDDSMIVLEGMTKATQFAISGTSYNQTADKVGICSQSATDQVQNVRLDKRSKAVARKQIEAQLGRLRKDTSLPSSEDHGFQEQLDGPQKVKQPTLLIEYTSQGEEVTLVRHDENKENGVSKPSSISNVDDDNEAFEFEGNTTSRHDVNTMNRDEDRKNISPAFTDESTRAITNDDLNFKNSEMEFTKTKTKNIARGEVEKAQCPHFHEKLTPAGIIVPIHGDGEMTRSNFEYKSEINCDNKINICSVSQAGLRGVGGVSTSYNTEIITPKYETNNMVTDFVFDRLADVLKAANLNTELTTAKCEENNMLGGKTDMDTCQVFEEVSTDALGAHAPGKWDRPTCKYENFDTIGDRTDDLKAENRDSCDTKPFHENDTMMPVEVGVNKNVCPDLQEGPRDSINISTLRFEMTTPRYEEKDTTVEEVRVPFSPEQNDNLDEMDITFKDKARINVCPISQAEPTDVLQVGIPDKHATTTPKHEKGTLKTDDFQVDNYPHFQKRSDDVVNTTDPNDGNIKSLEGDKKMIEEEKETGICSDFPNDFTRLETVCDPENIAGENHFNKDESTIPNEEIDILVTRGARFYFAQENEIPFENNFIPQSASLEENIDMDPANIEDYFRDLFFLTWNMENTGFFPPDSNISELGSFSLNPFVGVFENGDYTKNISGEEKNKYQLEDNCACFSSMANEVDAFLTSGAENKTELTNHFEVFSDTEQTALPCSCDCIERELQKYPEIERSYPTSLWPRSIMVDNDILDIRRDACTQSFFDDPGKIDHNIIESEKMNPSEKVIRHYDHYVADIQPSVQNDPENNLIISGPSLHHGSQCHVPASISRAHKGTGYATNKRQKEHALDYSGEELDKDISDMYEKLRDGFKSDLDNCYKSPKYARKEVYSIEKCKPDIHHSSTCDNDSPNIYPPTLVDLTAVKAMRYNFTAFYKSVPIAEYEDTSKDGIQDLTTFIYDPLVSCALNTAKSQNPRVAPKKTVNNIYQRDYKDETFKSGVITPPEEYQNQASSPIKGNGDCIIIKSEVDFLSPLNDQEVGDIIGSKKSILGNLNRGTARCLDRKTLSSKDNLYLTSSEYLSASKTMAISPDERENIFVSEPRESLAPKVSIETLRTEDNSQMIIKDMLEADTTLSFEPSIISEHVVKNHFTDDLMESTTREASRPHKLSASGEMSVVSRSRIGDGMQISNKAFETPTLVQLGLEQNLLGGVKRDGDCFPNNPAGIHSGNICLTKSTVVEVRDEQEFGSLCSSESTSQHTPSEQKHVLEKYAMSCQDPPSSMKPGECDILPISSGEKNGRLPDCGVDKTSSRQEKNLITSTSFRVSQSDGINPSGEIQRQTSLTGEKNELKPIEKSQKERMADLSMKTEICGDANVHQDSSERNYQHLDMEKLCKDNESKKANETTGKDSCHVTNKIHVKKTDLSVENPREVIAVSEAKDLENDKSVSVIGSSSLTSLTSSPSPLCVTSSGRDLWTSTKYTTIDSFYNNRPELARIVKSIVKSTTRRFLEDFAFHLRSAIETTVRRQLRVKPFSDQYTTICKDSPTQCPSLVSGHWQGEQTTISYETEMPSISLATTQSQSETVSPPETVDDIMRPQSARECKTLLDESQETFCVCDTGAVENNKKGDCRKHEHHMDVILPGYEQSTEEKKENGSCMEHLTSCLEEGKRRKLKGCFHRKIHIEPTADQSSQNDLKEKDGIQKEDTASNDSITKFTSGSGGDYGRVFKKIHSFLSDLEQMLKYYRQQNKKPSETLYYRKGSPPRATARKPSLDTTATFDVNRPISNEQSENLGSKKGRVMCPPTFTCQTNFPEQINQRRRLLPFKVVEQYPPKVDQQMNVSDAQIGCPRGKRDMGHQKHTMKITFPQKASIGSVSDTKLNFSPRKTKKSSSFQETSSSLTYPSLLTSSSSVQKAPVRKHLINHSKQHNNGRNRQRTQGLVFNNKHKSSESNNYATNTPAKSRSDYDEMQTIESNCLNKKADITSHNTSSHCVGTGDVNSRCISWQGFPKATYTCTEYNVNTSRYEFSRSFPQSGSFMSSASPTCALTSQQRTDSAPTAQTTKSCNDIYIRQTSHQEYNVCQCTRTCTNSSCSERNTFVDEISKFDDRNVHQVTQCTIAQYLLKLMMDLLPQTATASIDKPLRGWSPVRAKRQSTETTKSPYSGLLSEESHSLSISKEQPNVAMDHFKIVALADEDAAGNQYLHTQHDLSQENTILSKLLISTSPRKCIINTKSTLVKKGNPVSAVDNQYCDSSKDKGKVSSFSYGQLELECPESLQLRAAIFNDKTDTTLTRDSQTPQICLDSATRVDMISPACDVGDNSVLLEDMLSKGTEDTTTFINSCMSSDMILYSPLTDTISTNSNDTYSIQSDFHNKDSYSQHDALATKNLISDSSKLNDSNVVHFDNKGDAKVTEQSLSSPETYEAVNTLNKAFCYSQYYESSNVNMTKNQIDLRRKLLDQIQKKIRKTPQARTVKMKRIKRSKSMSCIFRLMRSNHNKFEYINHDPSQGRSKSSSDQIGAGVPVSSSYPSSSCELFLPSHSHFFDMSDKMTKGSLDFSDKASHSYEDPGLAKSGSKKLLIQNERAIDVILDLEAQNEPGSVEAIDDSKKKERNSLIGERDGCNSHGELEMLVAIFDEREENHTIIDTQYSKCSPDQSEISPRQSTSENSENMSMGTDEADIMSSYNTSCECTCSDESDGYSESSHTLSEVNDEIKIILSECQSRGPGDIESDKCMDRLKGILSELHQKFDVTCSANAKITSGVPEKSSLPKTLAKLSDNRFPILSSFNIPSKDTAISLQGENGLVLVSDDKGDKPLSLRKDSSLTPQCNSGVWVSSGGALRSNSENNESDKMKNCSLDIEGWKNKEEPRCNSFYVNFKSCRNKPNREVLDKIDQNPPHENAADILSEFPRPCTSRESSAEDKLEFNYAPTLVAIHGQGCCLDVNVPKTPSNIFIGFYENPTTNHTTPEKVKSKACEPLNKFIGNESAISVKDDIVSPHTDIAQIQPEHHDNEARELDAVNGTCAKVTNSKKRERACSNALSFSDKEKSSHDLPESAIELHGFASIVSKLETPNNIPLKTESLINADHIDTRMEIPLKNEHIQSTMQFSFDSDHVNSKMKSPSHLHQGHPRKESSINDNQVNSRIKSSSEAGRVDTKIETFCHADHVHAEMKSIFDACHIHSKIENPLSIDLINSDLKGSFNSHRVNPKTECALDMMSKIETALDVNPIASPKEAPFESHSVYSNRESSVKDGHLSLDIEDSSKKDHIKSKTESPSNAEHDCSKMESLSDADHINSKAESTSDADHGNSKLESLSDVDCIGLQLGSSSNTDQESSKNESPPDADHRNSNMECPSDDDHGNSKVESLSDVDCIGLRLGSSSNTVQESSNNESPPDADHRNSNMECPSYDDHGNSKVESLSDVDCVGLKLGSSFNTDQESSNKESPTYADHRNTIMECPSDVDHDNSNMESSPGSDAEILKTESPSSSDPHVSKTESPSNVDHESSKMEILSGSDPESSTMKSPSNVDFDGSNVESPSNIDYRDSIKECPFDADQTNYEMESTSNAENGDSKKENPTDTDHVHLNMENRSDADHVHSKVKGPSDDDHESFKMESPSEVQHDGSKMESLSDVDHQSSSMKSHLDVDHDDSKMESITDVDHGNSKKIQSQSKIDYESPSSSNHESSKKETPSNIDPNNLKTESSPNADHRDPKIESPSDAGKGDSIMGNPSDVDRRNSDMDSLFNVNYKHSKKESPSDDHHGNTVVEIPCAANYGDSKIESPPDAYHNSSIMAVPSDADHKDSKMESPFSADRWRSNMESPSGSDEHGSKRKNPYHFDYVDSKIETLLYTDNLQSTMDCIQGVNQVYSKMGTSFKVDQVGSKIDSSLGACYKPSQSPFDAGHINSCMESVHDIDNVDSKKRTAFVADPIQEGMPMERDNAEAGERENQPIVDTATDQLSSFSLQCQVHKASLLNSTDNEHFCVEELIKYFSSQDDCTPTHSLNKRHHASPEANVINSRKVESREILVSSIPPIGVEERRFLPGQSEPLCGQTLTLGSYEDIQTKQVTPQHLSGYTSPSHTSPDTTSQVTEPPQIHNVLHNLTLFTQDSCTRPEKNYYTIYKSSRRESSNMINQVKAPVTGKYQQLNKCCDNALIQSHDRFPTAHTTAHSLCQNTRHGNSAIGGHCSRAESSCLGLSDRNGKLRFQSDRSSHTYCKSKDPYNEQFLAKEKTRIKNFSDFKNTFYHNMQNPDFQSDAAEAQLRLRQRSLSCKRDAPNTKNRSLRRSNIPTTDSVPIPNVFLKERFDSNASINGEAKLPVELKKGTPYQIVEDFKRSNAKLSQIPVDIYTIKSGGRSNKEKKFGKRHDVKQKNERILSISGPIMNVTVPVNWHYRTILRDSTNTRDSSASSRTSNNHPPGNKLTRNRTRGFFGNLKCQSSKRNSPKTHAQGEMTPLMVPSKSRSGSGKEMNLKGLDMGKPKWKGVIKKIIPFRVRKS